MNLAWLSPAPRPPHASLLGGWPCRLGLALCLAWAAGACDSGVIDPGLLDASARADRPPGPDYLPPQDSGKLLDLAAVAGDPCTYGKCAEGLICMANVCHTMCNGGCGEAAPECPPGVGCYWASDFTGACIPGTGEPVDECGDGVHCEAGSLCVTISETGSSYCFILCDNGSCRIGQRCVETSTGCQICM